MAKFYAHELVLGQVNLLFAVLVVLGDRLAAERTRDAAAGLLFALAVVVKPYAVIFAPWLATRRNRTAFVTMVAGLAGRCCCCPPRSTAGTATCGCSATGGTR